MQICYIVLKLEQILAITCALYEQIAKKTKKPALIKNKISI